MRQTKINILVTGQIRNETIFASLVRHLVSVSAEVEQIVYSSWSSEISKAKEIINEDAIRCTIDFVDCGSPISISSTPHVSLTSFLYQFQQISSGLNFVQDKSNYTVRIRADMVNSEIIRVLIQALNSHLTDRPEEDRSFIFGAMSLIGYYFEDRVMIISPKNCRAFQSFPLARLHKCTPLNLFPEFLLYSGMINAPDECFMYDFRFRIMHNETDNTFTSYDFEFFKDAYEDYVGRYQDDFLANFGFFKELFDDEGRYQFVKERLSSDWKIYNQTEYVDFMRKDQDIYREEYNTYLRVRLIESTEYFVQGIDKPCLPLSLVRIALVSDAKLATYADFLYRNLKYSEVVDLEKYILKMSFLKEEAIEKLGCAFFHIGNQNNAFLLLRLLFDCQHRSFDYLYYLCIILKNKELVSELYDVCVWFKSLYPDHPVVQEHITNLLGCDIKDFNSIESLEKPQSSLDSPLLTEHVSILLTTADIEPQSDAEKIVGNDGIKTITLDLSNEISQLHSQITSLLRWFEAYNLSTTQSLSWKLTKPLRWLGLGKPKRPLPPKFD